MNTVRNLTRIAVVMLVIAGLVSLGCGWSRTAKGGAIGAAGGAVVGGAIGRAAGNTAVGAIIGAAIGGTAGALIGNYMDRQAAEIQNDIEGARVERVGEGIKITFASGILFKTNSSDLQPEASANVDKLAVILNKYSDTNILIEGHTDSDGSEEYNQKLSERRAESVANKLKGQGVQGPRLTNVGYGESQPMASNDTAGGKQANRRVEVAIFANDKLKEAAKNNQLN